MKIQLKGPKYNKTFTHLLSMMGSDRAPVAETVLRVGACEVAI